jgi:hypothetical protein
MRNQARRAARRTFGLVVFASIATTVALACSSNEDTTPAGQTDAAAADGNSPLCPASAPTAGQPCSVSVACTYGQCKDVSASCVAGVWQVAISERPCQVEDPCGAVGGSCSCGQCAGGFVKDESVTCPATSGPGCVQQCCRPSVDSGRPDAPSDAPDAG